MIPQQPDRRSSRSPHSVRSTASGDRAKQGGARSKARWSPLAVLLPGLMLWFEAALVQSSDDTPGIVVPAAAIAGSIGLFLHLPILSRPFWFRLLLGALGVLLLVRLAMFPPGAVESGFVVVPRVLTITLAEFFLCCQALLLWRWRSSDSLPIAFPCLALATSIFALNKALPQGMQSAYVVLATVSLLLPTLMATSQSTSSRSRRQALPWNARLALGLVCLSVLLGTWTVAQAWSRWLPDAQAWFATTVGRAVNEHLRLRYYATSGSLTAIRMENSTHPNRTALRVYCDEQPGYLAGRIFDQYEGGNWRVASDHGQRGSGQEPTGRRIVKPLDSAPDAIGGSVDELSVFEVSSLGSSNSLRRMTIVNDPRRGRVFFTPLRCRYLLAKADSLAIDEHDIIRSGLNVRRPYVAIVDATGPARPLSDQQRRQLLAPLTGLDSRVAGLADQVCRRARTPQDKIRAIRAHFRDHYEYRLKPVEVPRGIDPLTHFLLTRHPAHCEFFASGAVALLRLQGIPARYATGYCVMQLEPKNEDYWIARNRDAHAWAEAFDEQQQRWIIVEATPGFTDPFFEDPFGADENAAGAQGSGLVFTAGNASALAQWWRDLPAVVRYTVLTLVTAAFGLTMVVFVRRTHMARSTHVRESRDPRIWQWQRLLRRMDRRLLRRGLVRHRSETVHQFAHRIRLFADGQDIWMHSSADWYLDYAATRFGTTELLPPRLPPKRSPRDKGSKQRLKISSG